MINIEINKLVQKNIDLELRIKKLLINNDKAFNSLIDLYSIVNNIYPSYIAPAYHLNAYNKFINESLVESLDNKSIHAILQIEFQDALIAIKGLLDRIVKIIAIYYKGISKKSTFGSINTATGKATNFMSYVVEMADKDEFLNFIFSEYNDWINKAVGPRDKIIHYNDLPVIYRVLFDPEKSAVDRYEIIHLNKDLYDSIDLRNRDQINDLAFNNIDLEKFVIKLYELYDLTIKTIIGKYE